MPKSSKPRKKYRPKSRLVNPMAWLLEGFSPLEQQSQYMVDLRLKNANALDMLVRGQAAASHVNLLLGACNVTQALVHMGVGAEYDDVAYNGRAALTSVTERGMDMQRFVCKGEEIKHIKHMMELHDAQLAVITLEKLEKAIDLCKGKKIPRLFHYEVRLNDTQPQQHREPA